MATPTAKPVSAASLLVTKQRLTKEYKQITLEPIDNCMIRIEPKDLFKWYFVLDGISETEYEGGKYFGYITFPKEYPFKPPAVFIETPNGTIRTGESICMSMTDWHPESWNPSWGPRTIVLGLFVFLENVLNGEDSSATAIYGASKEDVKTFAAQSKQNNCDMKLFQTIFPELVEEWKKKWSLSLLVGNKTQKMIRKKSDPMYIVKKKTPQNMM